MNTCFSSFFFFKKKPDVQRDIKRIVVLSVYFYKLGNKTATIKPSEENAITAKVDDQRKSGNILFSVSQYIE
jgi:hypothetical protein